jgi:DNA-binding LytR/AlgR family response regulator
LRDIKARFQKKEELEHIDVLISAPEQDRQVRELLELIEAQRQLLIATGKNGTLLRFEPNSILRISSVGKHTEIVTENEHIAVRQSLSELERQLRGSCFIRIARHELVNLSKVRKYDFTLAGTLRLEFADGMETWASRRCIPAIRARLNGKEAEKK